MLDSTYGAFEADVSYLNACPTIYPGQADYPTEAPQIWAFPVHPSDAPQLPPLEALQRADLAPEVQVTEAAAGGSNFAGGALTHPMQYFTDGAEEYPQVTMHVVSERSKFTEISANRVLILPPTSIPISIYRSLVKYTAQRKLSFPGSTRYPPALRLNFHPQTPCNLHTLLQRSK